MEDILELLINKKCGFSTFLINVFYVYIVHKEHKDFYVFYIHSLKNANYRDFAFFILFLIKFISKSINRTIIIAINEYANIGIIFVGSFL